MNYLKAMKDITKSDFLARENEAYRINYEACNLIKGIAQKMYDNELDRSRYAIWEAVINLMDAMKCRP